MPGTSAFKTGPAMLGKLLFCAKMHKRPDKDWDGVPDGQQYGECREAPDKIAIPGHFGPLPWFTPQAMHKDYQEMCDQLGKDYEKMYDTILDAWCFGMDMYKLQAKLSDLKVIACCALGTPGCLSGPDLENEIKNAPQAAALTGDNAKKFLEAAAKGIGKCFKEYQDKVMVPMLPWYPAFAAYPGPTAPPMPNIPMPLITCVSPMVMKITMPKMITDACVDALDSGIKDNDADKVYQTFFDAIGIAVGLTYLMWLVAQQVMLCMGKGPAPGYCPPYIPVFPVLVGDNVATPGNCIMA